MLVKRTLSACAVLDLVTLALPGDVAEAQVAQLTVRSSAFAEDEAIPLRNFAYGENLSPEIMWSGARDAVMSAIEGHIIGEGRVTGIFERER